MATKGVSVKGDDKVVRALRDVADEVEDLDAFERIADDLARAAARHAPKRTGRLAGSLRGDRSKSKAIVRSTLVYAGPINYGWPARNIAPSGFMQKADQEIQPRAVRELENEINDVIRRKGLR